MKKSKIISLLLLIIGLSCLGYYVLNHSFKRKIQVLDCEGVYYKKIFEQPKPGFLNIAQMNANTDIGNCLCEKYIETKDSAYKKEILKIYDKVGMKWGNYEIPKIEVDTICKNKNEIFIKTFDL